jgi:hypothetical protein
MWTAAQLHFHYASSQNFALVVSEHCASKNKSGHDEGW